MNRTELAQALQAAGIPDRLYALPGLRDPEGWLDSYYLLVANAGSWEVGVFERGRGRLGARFASEDEACRWRLAELVFPEREPRVLGAEDEQRSWQRTEALIRAAMARTRPRPRLVATQRRTSWTRASSWTTSARRAGRSCTPTARRSSTNTTSPRRRA